MPDLDKCKSTPAPKFLARQKKILAKKFWYQIWTNVKVPQPPSEIFIQLKKKFSQKNSDTRFGQM